MWSWIFWRISFDDFSVGSRRGLCLIGDVIVGLMLGYTLKSELEEQESLLYKRFLHWMLIPPQIESARMERLALNKSGFPWEMVNNSSSTPSTE